MEFKTQKPIYRQIADYVLENVLSGAWKGGERIQSVREMAASVEVNPNTVMRSYTFLNEEGIIYNRRGIGYFLNDDAAEKAHQYKKTLFVKEELPEFFKMMDLLKIDFQELQSLYENNYSNEVK
ncbi:MAG: GntR family transcriptional regulator [Bacteroidota bacterium]